jgi:2-polyprenyl-6-methoxyphenol hydroxylase-like FAD-dependent oxidoreductase
MHPGKPCPQNAKLIGEHFDPESEYLTVTDTVLVVGAGPVGQTMALELARYKVRVRLIDRMTERSDKSRAVAIWARTLELLDRAGSSQDLVALGNKVTAANIIAGREAIARIELDDLDTPYPFALMLSQCATEAVLDRHLQRFGARTEMGVELTAFTQDDDGVAATLCHGDGRVETERFAWLIACDGAHSSVRHGLGLAFDGDTIGIDWALGDFRMTGSPLPLSELATYWHEDGPMAVFPLAKGRYRFIASLGPSTDEAPLAPTPDQFQALVDRRGPGGMRLTDPIWISVFRINERQVASYRVGRVFLAGDAAHVHSPAGGQGMNTGMQDAVNLAWKLAMVCRNMAAGPDLLESYDGERRPVGAAVIAAAGRLTKSALIRNPVGQHIRNAIAHVLLGLAPVRRAIEGSMTETSIGYPASPIHGMARGSNRRVGTRMPPLDGEAPYGAGDTPRFVVRAHAPAGLQRLTSVRALVDATIRPNAAGYGIELVRPDGYLAMSAPEGDWASVEAYLARLARA